MPANKENEQVILDGVGEYSGQCGTFGVIVSRRQTLPVLHNTFLSLAQYKMEARGSGLCETNSVERLMVPSSHI